VIVEYDVPFFANTPDDTHCFQAALRTVLKYYQPERDFSWEELERITLKKRDLWTWPTAGFSWLQDQGFEVHDVEAFDYERFVQEGEDYLIETFGQEVGGAQIMHSDIDRERLLAQDFLAKVKVEKRVPQRSEIEEYLQNGYLVVCNINAAALNNTTGYIGHFVVVTGFDNDSLRLHDAGLPARENRIVSKEQFEKAWAYPNDTAKNFVAVKPA
jgi:hypothetical protein